MEGSRNMVAVSFALMVVLIYLIASIYMVNPFLRKNFITLDDAVALYVDTLASTDKGSVRIPVEKGSVKSIEVAYRTKNNDEGILEDGWYVIAVYNLADERTEKSVSRISSYPSGAGLERSMFSPGAVCVDKEEDAKYARVRKC